MKNKLYIFTIIDLLFFPFLKGLAMPLSLPLNCLKFLRKKQNKKDLLSVIFLGIILVLGVIYGYFLNEEFLIDNLKRFILIYSSIITYFVYVNTNLSKKENDFLKKIYFIWLLMLVISIYCYLNYPLRYSNFLTSIYSDISKEGVRNAIIFFRRYTLYFTDPNATGYYICMLLAVFFSKLNKKEKLISILISGYGIYLTQSRGALVSLIIIIFVSFLKKLGRDKKKFLIILCSIITFILLSNRSEKEKVKRIDYTQNRLSQIEFTDGGGRLKKYNYLFEENTLYLIGRGYILENENYIFKPHSDIIRAISSYGLFFLGLLIYIFYKNKNKLYFYPSFICFTLNTLMDSQRTFIFFLLAEILTRESKYRK